MTDNRHRRATRLLGLLATGLCAAGLLTAPTAQAADPTPLRELAAAAGIHVGNGIEAAPLASIPAYEAIVGREYEAVTPGNEMKWGSVEPTRGQYNWGPADQIVAYAEANDQIVRGHTLVWHSQQPNWLTSGNFTPAQLRTILSEHIAVQAGRYEGRVYAWDVVNEPFNENGSYRGTIWYDNLGVDYIADSLRWARAADPGAKLYINDYNIEGINAKSNALYNLAVELLAAGVPLDGIGIQGHIIIGQVPSTFAANMQRFADLGLDVAITELDIRMQLPVTDAKLQTQAADYRSVFQSCIAVDGCIGVTVWGVTDGLSWIPDTFPGEGAALMHDAQYRPKPAWNSVYQLLGGTPPEEPGEPGNGTCAVRYSVADQWNNGFTGAITVANPGTTAIDGWELSWTFSSGQSVTNGWNGTWSQSGSTVRVTNAAWNRAIAPGGNVTLGFNASHSGTNPAPGTFTLNGTACTSQ
ncbi:endo-1,4-beta-xylanase [Nocardiopsis ansamitocini]|uniref:Beta-xylanase n=1 Tax=Nocardiopsis ansamitocini TaxID=1670832 RepID=A0A9W6P5F0_9ACTN|nr:endo-1,4-beta-xylanase [Nocardiopsis ansamitocini]GLU47392.1 hypothetical protein Nans01_17430 [Nocardiopsis ansamitocini]